MPHIQQWLDAGDHWLGLHGTSGGRAERVEGLRQRRIVKTEHHIVKTEHHALLGSYFLTHPPICKFRVGVAAIDHPSTEGLGKSFIVEDEPYFIELQDPASTQILLAVDYGPTAEAPAIGTIYPSDTSLQPDGRTRVIGYTRGIGGGRVTYFALGHFHSPNIRGLRPVDPGTNAAAVSWRVGY
ncbi:MAG: ThuA domain-containing protein [Acetobacteraceae bacterium]|nr:ThuA domain-containing protein [Acetobacteraceae bacterium]